VCYSAGRLNSGRQQERVCCNVLRYVAAGVVRCVAVYRSVVPTKLNGRHQDVAACCSVLQCVVVCCSAYTRNNGRWQDTVCCSVLQYVAVCCSVLQCAAVCRSVLQCAAVCADGTHLLQATVE